MNKITNGLMIAAMAFCFACGGAESVLDESAGGGFDFAEWEAEHSLEAEHTGGASTGGTSSGGSVGSGGIYSSNDDNIVLPSTGGTSSGGAASTGGTSSGGFGGLVEEPDVTPVVDDDNNICTTNYTNPTTGIVTVLTEVKWAVCQGTKTTYKYAIDCRSTYDVEVATCRKFNMLVCTQFCNK